MRRAEGAALISRLPGSRCLEVSGCSLRRKAGGRVAHDERRAISIAGVRPLDWIARVRAQRSCFARPSAIAWRGRCKGGATRARAAWRWAWERAMIMRVSAQGQAYGYLGAREQLGSGARFPLLH